MEEERGALPPKMDFSAWYNDLLWQAEIMDVRYPVKGLYVWYPHGFAIRKHVYAWLRELCTSGTPTGLRSGNMSMPGSVSSWTANTRKPCSHS